MIRFVTAKSSFLLRLENHRREIFTTVESADDRRVVLTDVRDHDGRVLPDTAVHRTKSLAGVAEGDRVRLRVTISIKTASRGRWASMRLLRPVLVGLSAPRAVLQLVAR